MTGRGTGLLLVMMDIDPQNEEEFNRWYTEEHIPERLAIPGFVCARRYKALEGGPKYLALYELDNPQVLKSRDYIYRYEDAPTKWTQEILKKVTKLVRNVYVQIYAEERERTVTPLHVEISGPRSGPTLVLLHPLGANTRFWDECVSHWVSQYQVIAYDLRGAGLSPVPTGPCDISEHVNDLESLRVNLGLARIIPIGVAVGSMVAAAYAEHYPDRVPALVLCDPTLAIHRRGREMLEKRIGSIRRDGIKGILPGAVDKAFSQLPRDDRYHRYLERFRQNDPTGYEYLARGFLEVNLEQILPNIGCPTLVTVGEYDALFPVDEAKQVSANLLDASFEIMRGASHFPPFQTPKAFSGLVCEFLSSKLAEFC